MTGSRKLAMLPPDTVGYTLVPSSLGKRGKLFVAMTGRGICRVAFRRREFARFLREAERGWGMRVVPLKISGGLTRSLQRCFEGNGAISSIPVDPRSGTPFMQEVWRTLRTIPRGETRSYRWVAERIGRSGASRAVGSACGANPVPILVPCHRVVRSDGGLGGFTGGLSIKRKLLQRENAII